MREIQVVGCLELSLTHGYNLGKKDLARLANGSPDKPRKLMPEDATLRQLLAFRFQKLDLRSL